jgi:hypothetical protein
MIEVDFIKFTCKTIIHEKGNSPLYSYSFALLRLTILILFFSATTEVAFTQGGSSDAAVIVRRALVDNKRDLNALRDYIFLSDGTRDTFDKDGRVVKTSSKQQEIFFLDGLSYERIMLQDGQTLNETERAKQEANLDNQIKDSQSASPKHKDERERKAAKAIEEEIALREDVADGFTFKIVAEEIRGGDRCIKLNAEPKEKFKGKSSLHALFPYLHGSIWIDVDKGQWMDIDASLVKKADAGIVYVKDDSAIHLHQEPIRENLWVITKEDIRLDVRVLLERKNIHVVKTYSNFRRFTSTARILPVDDEAADKRQDSQVSR